MGHLYALSRLGARISSHSGPGIPDDDLIKPMPTAEDAEAFAEMIDRVLTGIAIASRRYGPQERSRKR